MEKIKIMIVDDSPFSRTILADALEEGGCEVVASVGDLEEALEEYRNCRPDIVTMDIAMPGADGFECSKALLREDSHARIILVSSMKDDETVSEANRIGIVGYLQKPIEGELLMAMVRNVMSPDTLFQKLEDLYLDAFKEALVNGFARMTKTVATIAQECQTQVQYNSQGVAVVIGITGKYSGRMLFDLSLETSEAMAKAALRRAPRNQDEVLAMVAEFANVIGGVACSMLNKKESSYKLKVTPPSIFYGAPTAIASPSMKSRGVCADTAFGSVHLNVGFKQGHSLWV